MTNPDQPPRRPARPAGPKSDIREALDPAQVVRRARIGTDEAGKGDYFGDLVVAGIYLDRDGTRRAQALGVVDSKRLSDRQVLELAPLVREAFAGEVVRITPATYNDLYPKLGSNLNRLLAWAHARVIENLLPRTEAQLVVVDQFAGATMIERALTDVGRTVEVFPVVQGERDLAVAAASIVARATFLQQLKLLSDEMGMRLPKGSTHVLSTAKELYARGGLELLRRVAKLHFAITEQLQEPGLSAPVEGSPDERSEE
jgi:ribonuclease HIII